MQQKSVNGDYYSKATKQVNSVRHDGYWVKSDDFHQQPLLFVRFSVSKSYIVRPNIYTYIGISIVMVML